MRQNGTPYIFTIMVVGSCWWSLFGCVATAASGALMMDCLPSDERGQPTAAARDLNLHEWARRIPETGFPLLLATSMTWFPSHLVAFNWYFLVGGTVSNIAWLIFITTIHPRDEPLDKDFQHLRYYFCPEYKYYGPRACFSRDFLSCRFVATKLNKGLRFLRRSSATRFDRSREGNSRSYCATT
eukprot:SAG31_NODE_1444_length_8321_cov_2.478716_8_plen_184_part_00